MDSECVRAQITCKHSDDTQTRQNTGKPPECCKTKPKHRIQINKQIQVDFRYITVCLYLYFHADHIYRKRMCMCVEFAICMPT